MSMEMRLPRTDARIAPEVDSLTLAGLRTILAEDFDAAPTGEILEAKLANKGYMLRRYEGTMYLATAPHGKLICDLNDLSYKI